MSHTALVATVFLVCLVAVCAQSLNHHSRSETSQKASAKMLNPLTVMQEIMHPTTKAPSPAMQKMSMAASAAVRVIDGIANTITGLIDRARDIQSMTRKAAQDTIDGVVARSEDIAVQRGGEPECVIKMMGRAGGLGMQIALNEVDCPGNKIKALEDMSETMVKASDTALTMLPRAELELDKCERKGGPFELICSAKVVTGLAQRAASVVVQATTVAAEAASLAATIEPSLATCASLKVAQSAARAATLVGKFGACTGNAVSKVVG